MTPPSPDPAGSWGAQPPRGTTGAPVSSPGTPRALVSSGQRGREGTGIGRGARSTRQQETTSGRRPPGHPRHRVLTNAGACSPEGRSRASDDSHPRPFPPAGACGSPAPPPTPAPQRGPGVPRVRGVLHVGGSPARSPPPAEARLLQTQLPAARPQGCSAARRAHSPCSPHRLLATRTNSFRRRRVARREQEPWNRTNEREESR